MLFNHHNFVLLCATLLYGVLGLRTDSLLFREVSCPLSEESSVVIVQTQIIESYVLIDQYFETNTVIYINGDVPINIVAPTALHTTITVQKTVHVTVTTSIFSPQSTLPAAVSSQATDFAISEATPTPRVPVSSDPFILGIHVIGSARKGRSVFKSEKLPVIGYVHSDARVVETAGQATVFQISADQLVSGDKFVSTDLYLEPKAFVVSQTIGSISTSFSTETEFLIWSNDSFSNGIAQYCIGNNNITYVTFMGVVPLSCTPVNLVTLPVPALNTTTVNVPTKPTASQSIIATTASEDAPPTPSPFAIGASLGGSRKRQNEFFYLKSTGILVSDAGSALVFHIDAGQLSAGGYLMTAPENLNANPFLTATGSISTTFSVINGNFDWENQAFFNKKAQYCVYLESMVLFSYFNGTLPSGCTQISLAQVSMAALLVALQTSSMLAATAQTSSETAAILGPTDIQSTTALSASISPTISETTECVGTVTLTSFTTVYQLTSTVANFSTILIVRVNASSVESRPPFTSFTILNSSTESGIEPSTLLSPTILSTVQKNSSVEIAERTSTSNSSTTPITSTSVEPAPALTSSSALQTWFSIIEESTSAVISEKLFTSSSSTIPTTTSDSTDSILITTSENIAESSSSTTPTTTSDSTEPILITSSEKLLASSSSTTPTTTSDSTSSILVTTSENVVESSLSTTPATFSLIEYIFTTTSSSTQQSTGSSSISTTVSVSSSSSTAPASTGPIGTATGPCATTPTLFNIQVYEVGYSLQYLVDIDLLGDDTMAFTQDAGIATEFRIDDEGMLYVNVTNGSNQYNLLYSEQDADHGGQEPLYFSRRDTIKPQGNYYPVLATVAADCIIALVFPYNGASVTQDCGDTLYLESFAGAAGACTDLYLKALPLVNT